MKAVTPEPKNAGTARLEEVSDGMRARAQYWQRPSRSWWFPGNLLGDERWGYQIFQLAMVQSPLAVLPVAT
jgi:hypothetical protein